MSSACPNGAAFDEETVESGGRTTAASRTPDSWGANGSILGNSTITMPLVPTVDATASGTAADGSTRRLDASRGGAVRVQGIWSGLLVTFFGMFLIVL